AAENRLHTVGVIQPLGARRLSVGGHGVRREDILSDGWGQCVLSTLLVHLPRSAWALSWERRAPARLQKPRWSVALPAKALTQQVLRKCIRAGRWLPAALRSFGLQPKDTKGEEQCARTDDVCF